MKKQLIQFKLNDVCDLVQRYKDKSVIGTRLVYRKKLDESGINTRNKAKIVEIGYSQAKGIDYEDTYDSVALLEEIRLLLAFSSICCLNLSCIRWVLNFIFLKAL